PAWLADLPTDRPLVLAALGTYLQVHAPRLLESIVHALAELRCSAIVVTGRNLDADRFPVPAPHLRVVEYVPQGLLLPACDLFITHAGANSLREAMQAGVPMVLTPLGADQPHNANRARDWGLGLPVPAATATAAVIREACERVLADPGFGERARLAQRRFLAL